MARGILRLEVAERLCTEKTCKLTAYAQSTTWALGLSGVRWRGGVAVRTKVTGPALESGREERRRPYLRSILKVETRGFPDVVSMDGRRREEREESWLAPEHGSFQGKPGQSRSKAQQSYGGGHGVSGRSQILDLIQGGRG